MDPQYPAGAIVWVKLEGGRWWPGEVASESDCSDVLENLRKPPLAVVKFFEEDCFHIVKSDQAIHPYECAKKQEFLKRGKDFKMSGKDAFNLQLKFDSDVAKAEAICRPAKRFSVSKSSRLPSSPRSGNLSYIKAPSAERFDYNTMDEERRPFSLFWGRYEDPGTPRIRQQPATPKAKDSEYTCDTCGYKTARLENIVRHHKSHSDPYSFHPGKETEPMFVFEKANPLKYRKKAHKEQSRHSTGSMHTHKARSPQKKLDKGRIAFIPTPKKRKLPPDVAHSPKDGAITKKKSKASQVVLSQVTEKKPFINPFEEEEEAEAPPPVPTAIEVANENKPEVKEAEECSLDLSTDLSHEDLNDKDNLEMEERKPMAQSTVAWEEFIKDSPTKIHDIDISRSIMPQLSESDSDNEPMPHDGGVGPTNGLMISDPVHASMDFLPSPIADPVNFPANNVPLSAVESVSVPASCFSKPVTEKELVTGSVIVKPASEPDCSPSSPVPKPAAVLDHILGGNVTEPVVELKHVSASQIAKPVAATEHVHESYIAKPAVELELFPKSSIVKPAVELEHVPKSNIKPAGKSEDVHESVIAKLGAGSERVHNVSIPVMESCVPVSPTSLPAVESVLVPVSRTALPVVESVFLPVSRVSLPTAELARIPSVSCVSLPTVESASIPSPTTEPVCVSVSRSSVRAVETVRVSVSQVTLPVSEPVRVPVSEVSLSAAESMHIQTSRMPSAVTDARPIFETRNSLPGHEPVFVPPSHIPATAPEPLHVPVSEIPLPPTEPLHVPISEIPLPPSDPIHIPVSSIPLPYSDPVKPALPQERTLTHSFNHSAPIDTALRKEKAMDSFTSHVPIPPISSLQEPSSQTAKLPLPRSSTEIVDSHHQKYVQAESQPEEQMECDEVTELPIASAQISSLSPPQVLRMRSYDSIGTRQHQIPPVEEVQISQCDDSVEVVALDDMTMQIGQETLHETNFDGHNTHMHLTVNDAHSDDVIIENTDMVHGDIVVADGSLHAGDIMVGEEIEVQEIEIGEEVLQTEEIVLSDGVMHHVEIPLESDVHMGEATYVENNHALSVDGRMNLNSGLVVQCVGTQYSCVDTSDRGSTGSQFVSKDRSSHYIASAKEAMNKADCGDTLSASEQLRLDECSIVNPAELSSSGSQQIASGIQRKFDTVSTTSFDSRSSTSTEGDSDNELPPAFTAQETKCHYHVDDIVWVKYKKIYWPAVVCKIYEKEKKLTVMYVDEPGQFSRGRISFHRAKNYRSLKSSQLLADISDPVVDAWKNAVNKAEEYLCKRAAKGPVVSPVKYFQCPYMYSCLEPELVEKDNSEQSDITPSPNALLEITDQKHQAAEATNNSNKELATQNRAKLEERRQFTDSMLASIKSEDCKAHLLQILTDKVNSNRHTKFFSPVSSVRRQLKWEAGFGPIEDSGMHDEICRYLTDLCKCEDIPEHFDVTAYVFEVWIPEAIIWTLGKILQVSSQEAEVYFRKGTYEGMPKGTAYIS